MSSEHQSESGFIVDRMLGTLSRYLRFMGYDTVSASSLREGNNKEDTQLLHRAREENRVLLTRDRELARRGGKHAVLVQSEDVIVQVRQLTDLGLVKPELRMTRCSICNEPLRPATRAQVEGTSYAPEKKDGLSFFWCRRCRKLYWMGSHGRNLQKRLEKCLKDS